jgi:hypothetical protein
MVQIVFPAFTTLQTEWLLSVLAANKSSRPGAAIGHAGKQSFNV